MKKQIILFSFALIACMQTKAQFGTYGTGGSDGFTFGPVQSIGLGGFNPTDVAAARFHIRNDMMANPTSSPFNSSLLRSDGNSSYDNLWQMYTGSGTSSSGYNEIFRIGVPSTTSNFLLQSSQTSGDMIFNTGGANQRAIITSAGLVGINTASPGNQFELNSGTANLSGFRFTQLTNAYNPTVNSSKVLSVDANGDVILVNASGAGATAKNGLNTSVGAPDVELGGLLIRTTVVDQNNFDLVFNNTGIFSINSNPAANAGISGSRFEVLTNDDYNSSANILQDYNPTSGTIGNNYALKTINISQNNVSGSAAFAGWFETTNPIEGVAVSAYAHGNSNISSPNLFKQTGIVAAGNDAPYTIGGEFLANQPPLNSLSVMPIESKAVVARCYDASNNSYGVYANTASDANDVYGVYAITSSPTSNFPGNYYSIYGDALSTAPNVWAGYFNGNVNVNGTPNFLNIPVIYSDQSLKRNVQSVKNALEILNKLSPKSYDLYNDNCKQLNFSGTKTQFGLIAQEVEKVIPEIVYDLKVPATKDIKGNIINSPKDLKGVSYDQLISILIKGTQEQQEQIQEQQKQIDELKTIVQELVNNGNNSSRINSQTVSLSDRTTIVLDQNVPNPFLESTVITYDIPMDFNKAQIVFTTNEGKQIKTVEITTRGQGKLSVFASDLTNGMYSYTLIVDNNIIDTKKLIKTH